MTNPYQSLSAEQHRQNPPTSIGCAVLTVSDTRTQDDDTSGRTIVDLLQQAGHAVIERVIVPDEPIAMTELLTKWRDMDTIDVILLTGGTGITSRDQTPETIAHLITKELPGYGELFRMLSYEEIGSAAMMSRAVGGLIERTVVMTMPGSTAAVRLAMEKLILPELGHLVSHAQR